MTDAREPADWNVHEGTLEPHPSDGGPVAVVSFLSGSRRGATARLMGDRITIGTDPSSDVRVPLDTAPLPLPHHATLLRREGGYELRTEAGGDVWVNGRNANEELLASGDILEIGRDGAVLRYRVYETDRRTYKSLGEVFSDCLECARAEETLTGKAAAWAVGVPRELATQTSRHFRSIVVAFILVLSVATVLLARQNAALEERLMAEVERVAGLQELVERARSQGVPVEELADVLGEIEAGLSATSQRVEALEARGEAVARVISGASRSTIFLQSSYRFLEPSTDRPLRLMLMPNGQPLRDRAGQPALTLEGDGPPLEVFVTGTAFVVSGDGLILTNRHVAVPWEFDEAATGILDAGFRPEASRFIGYLPGTEEPFDLTLVTASDGEDLAVLRSSGLPDDVPVLELADTAPSPGEQVVVLGYPLGLRALVARSDAAFVERLRRENISDFWEQARELSLAGFITPLASQGIVGQVTGERVVYDAETTSGGSGGPVLSLDGKVVGVNTAILPEFGGANMGVAAAAARSLLEAARER